MTTTAAAVAHLRALADFVEQEGIEPSRFAASGDQHTLVLVLISKMPAGLDMIEICNRPDGKARQKRLPLDPDAQMPLL